MSVVLARRDRVLFPPPMDVFDSVCLLCSSKFVLLSFRTDSTTVPESLRRRFDEHSSLDSHWRFRPVGGRGLVGFLDAVEGC